MPHRVGGWAGRQRCGLQVAKVLGLKRQILRRQAVLAGVLVICAPAEKELHASE